MPNGQRVAASATLSASGNSGDSQVFTPDQFTTTDNTSLSSSDAVVIRTIVFENSITIDRIGDPDGDSTFEISVQYASPTAGGERSDETLISLNDASIRITNDAGSTTGVTVIGTQVDSANMIAAQARGLNDGEYLNYTTSSGTEDAIYEVVHTNDYDLVREHDTDDDGTYEISATIESVTGAGVESNRYHTMKTTAGYSNPEMRIRVQNTSGTTADAMLFGSTGIRV